MFTHRPVLLFALSALASILSLTLVSASSASSSSSTSSHKPPHRGIAWPWFETSPASTFSPGSTWIYNWEAYYPTGGNYTGMKFFPMQRTADGIENFKDYPAVKEAEYILGFNEPDNDSQANLSPSQAAQLWKEYIQPLRTSSRKLVSPAVTISGSAGQGIEWLQSFVKECNGCTFDAYAIHPYAATLTDLQEHITTFLDAGFKPLWITEINVSENYKVNGGSRFVKKLITYLESFKRSEVARYAFIARVDQKSTVAGRDLQHVSGKLTPAGVAWRDYKV